MTYGVDPQIDRRRSPSVGPLRHSRIVTPQPFADTNAISNCPYLHSHSFSCSIFLHYVLAQLAEELLATALRFATEMATLGLSDYSFPVSPSEMMTGVSDPFRARSHRTDIEKRYVFLAYSPSAFTSTCVCRKARESAAQLRARYSMDRSG